MVPELAVLLRVQRLQQRRRGVSPVIGAQLVDLVQDHDGITAAGLLDTGHDAAGHGPHIGLSVASYLRLVMDAAQRDAAQLPVHGPGNGQGDAGLSGARRAQQTEDGPLLVRSELPHSQIFHHPVLDLLQTEVVRVQGRAHRLRIQIVLRLLPPGDLQADIQITADDGGLGAAEGLFCQTPDLLKELIRHLFG